MNIATRMNERLTRLAKAQHLPRRTVRVRLTLLYGALFLVSGVALLAVTYGLFERATQFTKPQLPQIPRTPAIQELRSLLPRGYTPNVALTPGSPTALALPQIAAVQHQLTLDQRALFTQAPQKTQGQNPARFSGPVPGLLAEDQAQLKQDQQELKQDQRQLTQAVSQLAEAEHQLTRAGAVQAAQRTADSNQLLVDSAIALAIVAVLALLAGWLTAGRMLRPLRTITRKAQRISSASLHERLALDGPQDELKELGDTLDDLFGRLDAAFEAQRQFAANASHELRAPLARQRALIQVALADPNASFSSLRGAHERVLRSEQQLEQLIDGLLALTRGQAGLEHRKHLDLAELTSQALLARESELARRDLDVQTTLATARGAGDPRLVERLIVNLIDNAIRHNMPGGSVEVTTGTRDRRAFVSIANSGSRVPPEEIERLFQPFQRLEGARTRHDSGHGLGLSIVEAIADAHGAELSAHARAEGGLAIEVSFPPPMGVIPEPALALASGPQASAAAS